MYVLFMLFGRKVFDNFMFELCMLFYRKASTCFAYVVWMLSRRKVFDMFSVHFTNAIFQKSCLDVLCTFYLCYLTETFSKCFYLCYVAGKMHDEFICVWYISDNRTYIRVPVAGQRGANDGWLLDDGTELTYFNWYPGQPNNKNNNQDCLELKEHDQLWDCPCVLNFPAVFICEI